MTEIELSKELGVTRRVLIDMRKGLQEGLHWSADKKVVQYTAEGIKAVKDQLCVATVALQRDTHPPIQSAGEKSQGKKTPPQFVEANNMVATSESESPIAKSPEPIEKDVVALRVVKKPMNPKILFCERVENRPSTTELLVVRVPDNKNFIPGMELKAKPLPKGPWVLVGRCPRFRGKY